jgi:AraC-like DNA-binding protein
VPVIHQGRWSVVTKLARTPATPEEEFERQREHLDILVNGFVAAEEDFLERLPRTAPEVGCLSAPPAGGDKTTARARPRHPQILRAFEYVEEQFPDPELTIGGIARRMGVHPNYLSRLFAEQVGQRLSRFSAAGRIERAKTLLATTHWLVKRIAREPGYANANWLSTFLNPRPLAV